MAQRKANKRPMKQQVGFDVGTGPGGRTLVPWVPDGPPESTTSLHQQNDGPWDQFAANQKFGYKATPFNEEIYTTRLDKDQAGISEQDAERLAAEISAQNTNNPHLAEERGQIGYRELGDNEEERYSSVIRSQPSTGGSNSAAWANPAQSVAAVTSRPKETSPINVDQNRRQYKQIRSELGNHATRRDKISPSTSRPKSSPSENWLGEQSQVHALDLQLHQPKINEETRRHFDDFKRSKETSTVPEDSGATARPLVTVTPMAGQTDVRPADAAPAEVPVPKPVFTSKLNPNAPVFKLNPNAAEYVPVARRTPTNSSSPSQTSTPAHTPKNGHNKKTPFNKNGRGRNSRQGSRQGPWPPRQQGLGYAQDQSPPYGRGPNGFPPNSHAQPPFFPQEPGMVPMGHIPHQGVPSMPPPGPGPDMMHYDMGRQMPPMPYYPPAHIPYGPPMYGGSPQHGMPHPMGPMMHGNMGSPGGPGMMYAAPPSQHYPMPIPMEGPYDQRMPGPPPGGFYQS